MDRPRAPLGRSNPLIARLRALRRDRALREREGVFVAEGLHLAQEALAASAPIELAVVSPRLEKVDGGPPLRRRLVARDVLVESTADDVLRGVQDARSPQPILLVVRRVAPDWDRVWRAAGPSPFVLVAHGVQDPGNLGSLLRTADAAGAHALFTCGTATDRHHPRAVRASMGSIFRLATDERDAESLLEELRSRGIASIGAAPDGRLRYDECDWGGPFALWLGAEGQGLPPEILDRMERVVHVPMRSGADSLSVGAAAAVLLFEARRQRR